MEGFDFAVRSGPAGRVAGLASRTIARHATILCASPLLIARLGEPASLDDLDRYEALVYHRDGWTEGWSFPDSAGQIRTIEPRARLRFSDLGAILDAAVCARGIAWLPDWLIERELDARVLMPLLSGLPTRTHEITLFWPDSVYLAPRVRAAVEWLGSVGAD